MTLSGTRDSGRKILNGTLVGAAIGAVILFFFGDGLAMASYLAGEGVVIGGAIGGLVGVLVYLISRDVHK